MGVLRVWNGTGWDEIKGERGDTGASAYQIAVNEGFVGTEQEWLDSLAADPIDPVEIENAVATAIDAEPRVAQLVTDVARVAPPTAGSGVQQPRVTVNGPRWLPPDSVSPLLFDADADGTTDDYAAIMQAYDALGPRGGRLELSSQKYKINQTLEFNKPVTVDGSSGGYSASGGTVPGGGELIVAPGVSGIRLIGESHMSTLTNFTLSSQSTAAGSDVGIEVRSARWRADHLLIRKFGSHGFAVTGDTNLGTGNSNLGLAEQIRSTENRGHGIYVSGSDANVCTFIGPDVALNSGYGIYEDGMKNTYIGAHGNGNTLGDFINFGYSAEWLNPYAEALGTFTIDNTSYGGILISSGWPSVASGQPTVMSGPAGAYVPGTLASRARGWMVINNSKFVGTVEVEANNGAVWRITADTPGAGLLAIRSMVSDQNIISFRGDATVPNGLGFFGKAPTLQPAANPDTSGATLAQLETEVNQLKAALRALGLIAT